MVIQRRVIAIVSAVAMGATACAAGSRPSSSAPTQVEAIR
jgi:hypothetical protein